MIIDNNKNKIYNQDLQDIYNNTIDLLKPILDEFPEYALLTYGIDSTNLYYVKIKNKLYIYNNLNTPSPDIKDIHNSEDKYYFVIKEIPVIETVTPSNYLDNIMYKDTFTSYQLELTQNNIPLYIEGELVPEVHEFDLIYSDTSYNNVREILEKYVTIPDTSPTSNLCDHNRVRSFPEEGPILDPDGNPTTAILSTLIKGNVGGLTTGEPIKVERTNNNIRIIGSFSMVRRNSSHICRDNDCSYYGFQPLFILGYKDNYNAISYYIPKRTISIKSSSNSLEIANRSGRVTEDNQNSNYEILWLGEDIREGPGYIEEMYHEGIYTYGGNDPIHKEYFNFFKLNADDSIDFTSPKHFPGQFVVWSGVPFDKYNNSSFSINHSIEDLNEFSSIPQSIPGYADTKKQLIIPELYDVNPAVYGYQPSETIGTNMNVGFIRFKLKSESDYVMVRYNLESVPGTPESNPKYNFFRWDGTNTYGYPPNSDSNFLPDITTEPGVVVVDLFRKVGVNITFKVPTYDVLGDSVAIDVYNNKNTSPRIILTARQLRNDGFSIFNPDVVNYDYTNTLAGMFFAAEGPYSGGKMRQGGYLKGSFMHSFQVIYKNPDDSTEYINSTIKISDVFEDNYHSGLTYWNLDITEFNKIDDKYNDYIDGYRFGVTKSSYLTASGMYGSNFMKIPFDIFVNGTTTYNGTIDYTWKLNGVDIAPGSDAPISCWPDCETISHVHDLEMKIHESDNSCDESYNHEYDITSLNKGDDPTTYVALWDPLGGQGCPGGSGPEYEYRDMHYLFGKDYVLQECSNTCLGAGWWDRPPPSTFDWYPFLTMEPMRKRPNGTYISTYDIPLAGTVKFWNASGSKTQSFSYEMVSYPDMDPGVNVSSYSTPKTHLDIQRTTALETNYFIEGKNGVDFPAVYAGIYSYPSDSYDLSNFVSDILRFPFRKANILGYKDSTIKSMYFQVHFK